MLYYAYPNGHVGKAEFFEPYASLTGAIGPATAKVGVAYAWSQDAIANDDNIYVYGELGASIPETPISLSAHVGYTDGPLSPGLLTGNGDKNGWDYSVGASYQITKNLSLGVSYVGVDGVSIDSFSNDAVVGTLKFAM